MSRIALVAFTLSVHAGCVAGVLPPSRTEIGSTVIAAGGEMSSGYRFATGAHLASGTTRRDVSFDVGAGYVFERVGRSPLSGSPAGSTSLALSAPGAESIAPAEPADHVDAHGGYLEVARTLARGSGHRTWLGVRGEVLVREGPDGRRASTGVYARAAWEMFSPSAGAGGFSSSCGGGAGVTYGSSALGVFIEGGTQRTVDDEAAFVATAGLTLRLPFVAGFAFDVCPSC